MPARSLVTGAAGFIGAALARRLVARGDAVTLLSGPGSDAWRLEQLRDVAEVLEVDLRDADAVTRMVQAARPELVFHLAAHGAYSWQRSLPRMIETNVAGFAHVAEAAIEAGARAIVSAGSSSEYGLKDHAPPEHELPEPNSAYAVTKASATLLGGWLARERGAAITTLRLYSAYGPWEEPRRLMPALVAAGLDAPAAAARRPGDRARLRLRRGRRATRSCSRRSGRSRARPPSTTSAAARRRRSASWPRWPAAPSRSTRSPRGRRSPRATGTPTSGSPTRAVRARRLGWHPRTRLEAGLALFAHWMDEQPPPVGDRYRAPVGAA